MRQMVEVGSTLLGLGLVHHPTEADVRAKADRMRATARAQQADHHLFDVIDEAELAGLAEVRAMGAGRRGAGPAVLLVLMLGAVVAGIVLGAGVAALGAPQVVVGLVLALVVATVIPVGWWVARPERSGTLEA